MYRQTGAVSSKVALERRITHKIVTNSLIFLYPIFSASWLTFFLFRKGSIQKLEFFAPLAQFWFLERGNVKTSTKLSQLQSSKVDRFLRENKLLEKIGFMQQRILLFYFLLQTLSHKNIFPCSLPTEASVSCIKETVFDYESSENWFRWEMWHERCSHWNWQEGNSIHQ